MKNEMAAPRRFTATDTFRSLHATATERGEANDCVVKAYALMARVSYDVAHARAAAYGREERQGMYRRQWRRMCEETGVVLRAVPIHQFIDRYPGVHKNLHHVTTHHPVRFPAAWADGRRYLIVTRSHVAYVENGQLHDWSGGRSFRAVEVFEVVEP